MSQIMSDTKIVPLGNPQFTDRRTSRSPTAFEKVIVIGSIILVVIFFPLSLFFVFTTVTEYERAVIFRLGRLKEGGPRGPGLFFVLPCTDTYFVINLRTVTFDVPCQEVLTKDCVTVAVDAVVFYRVKDPMSAVLNIDDYRFSTQTLAATTLRNMMGTSTLAEVLTQREALARVMQSALDEATEPWGIEVERVELKDVRLPVQMQRAMAAEAEASREARAKLIAAEGELKAAQSLREAAGIMAQNPVTLQLRYLQTLNSIASETKATLVFPIPVNFLNSFGQ